MRSYLKFCRETFRRVIAVEPDLENFTRLSAYVANLPAQMQHRIDVVNCAVGSKQEMVRSTIPAALGRRCLL